MAFGHGLKKLQWLFSGDEINFVKFLGLSDTISLALVVIAEFVACLMIIVGYKTRFACLPIIFAMAYAAFITHASDPLFMQSADGGSKEPAMLFLFAFLAIYFLGSGRYSVDDRLDSAI